MPPSRLDMIYRRMLITRFFEKGWGKPENLQKLFEFRKEVSNRQRCYKLVPPDYPVQITHEERASDYHVIEGKFLTPLELYLPGLVPEAAKYAHFQMLLPLRWPEERFKPVCIHFAGTGDHFYWRRRNFIAKPLLREAGVGAILLENPFYGARKPDDQVRSNLNNVSDIFVMGGCLVLENLVLLHFCERMGLGPLGVTGLSMGGHNASLAATNWPKPLVLVPCLSWSTAAPVFTQGVMSQSINWDTLETQYFADGHYRERLAKMVTIVDDSFRAGQHFAKHFTDAMHELRTDIRIADDRGKALTERLPPNALNLSEPLLRKIHNGDLVSLTDAETRELNLKILVAQGKCAPPVVDVHGNGEEGRAGPPGDTGVAAAISSYITSGTSQLMQLIQPAAADTTSATPTRTIASSDASAAPSNSNNNNNNNSPAPAPAARITIDTTRDKWWECEALQFMRGVMDECTHLKNFSVPYDTSLITAVCAKDDAYVPRDGCSSLEEVWPGAEVKYLDAGHVSAYVLHQKLFRSCIAENFERAKAIYDPAQRADAPPAEHTFDELYTRYKERDRSADQSREQTGDGKRA